MFLYICFCLPVNACTPLYVCLPVNAPCNHAPLVKPLIPTLEVVTGSQTIRHTQAAVSQERMATAARLCTALLPGLRTVPRLLAHDGMLTALLCMAAGKRARDKPSVQQAGKVFMQLLQRAEQQGVGFEAY